MPVEVEEPTPERIDEAAEDDMEMLDFVASDILEPEVSILESEQVIDEPVVKAPVEVESVDAEPVVEAPVEVESMVNETMVDAADVLSPVAPEQVQESDVQAAEIEESVGVKEESVHALQEETPVTPQAESHSKPLSHNYQTNRGVLGEQSDAISDVRKAISITDRFLYLKELFGNNMDVFNDALDEINSAESMHEAASYLSQFNWEDNETSQQFMRLVSRRFI